MKVLQCKGAHAMTATMPIRARVHCDEKLILFSLRARLLRVQICQLWLPGEFSAAAVAQEALLTDDAGFGVDMLGVARGLAFEPALANIWQEREHSIELPVINWKNKTLASIAVMSVTKEQLNRMAHGKRPKTEVNPVFALLKDRLKTKIRTRRYRRWRDLTAQKKAEGSSL